jgi:hypothetical protein
MEIGVISAIDVDLAYAQEKDNLSNLIKGSLEKSGFTNSLCQTGTKKAKFIANMAVLQNYVIRINRNDKLLICMPLKYNKNYCLQFMEICALGMTVFKM